MVSKEQEHSCLTPIKDKSSLPKADKYANRFWVRWCKKPLVEIHCPLEDSTQKKTHKFYRRLACKVSKTTKPFHLNQKSHLVITLSLELLFVALLILPGSLCKHPISISLHLYIQLLIALEFAVHEATEEALLNYGLSFLRRGKGWQVSLFGQNSFKSVWARRSDYGSP